MAKVIDVWEKLLDADLRTLVSVPSTALRRQVKDQLAGKCKDTSAIEAVATAAHAARYALSRRKTSQKMRGVRSPSGPAGRHLERLAQEIVLVARGLRPDAPLTWGEQRLIDAAFTFEPSPLMAQGSTAGEDRHGMSEKHGKKKSPGPRADDALSDAICFLAFHYAKAMRKATVSERDLTFNSLVAIALDAEITASRIRDALNPIKRPGVRAILRVRRGDIT